MKVIFSLICLLFTLNSFAQDKEFKKLTRLYEKGKYEKCAEYAKDCIREYRNLRFPYDFAIKSYLASIPEAERISHEYLYLKKALRILERYPDTTNPTFILAYQELYTSAEDMKVDWENVNPRHVERLEQVMEKLHEMGAVPINPDAIELKDLNDPALAAYMADSIRTELLKNLRQYRALGRNVNNNASFVKYAYSLVNIELSGRAELIAKDNGLMVVMENAKAGDVILFGEYINDSSIIKDVAIILSNNQGQISLMHCTVNGELREITVEEWQKTWKPRMLFIKDFITTSL